MSLERIATSFGMARENVLFVSFYKIRSLPSSSVQSSIISELLSESLIIVESSFVTAKLQWYFSLSFLSSLYYLHLPLKT